MSFLELKDLLLYLQNDKGVGFLCPLEFVQGHQAIKLLLKLISVISGLFILSGRLSRLFTSEFLITVGRLN
jgi:hypothetical protein